MDIDESKYFIVSVDTESHKHPDERVPKVERFHEERYEPLLERFAREIVDREWEDRTLRIERFLFPLDSNWHAGMFVTPIDEELTPADIRRLKNKHSHEVYRTKERHAYFLA